MTQTSVELHEQLAEYYRLFRGKTVAKNELTEVLWHRIEDAELAEGYRYV